MAEYYDWQTIFSKDKYINIIVGARGIGKTFGLRLQTVNDFIKRGQFCMEIVRFKDEIPDLVRNYHSRLANFFPDWEFMAQTSGLYIRRRPEPGKKEAKWTQYGFIAAISQAHKKKRSTIPEGVHRIIFDEFTLDIRNTYARYLKNEVDFISSIVSTSSRERSDDKGGARPYLYLLGNATDRFNPYFEKYKLDADKLGLTIKNGVLFHNVPVDEDIYRGTLAHMIAGESRETAIAAGNAHAELPGAVPLLAVKWDDRIFTLYRTPMDWYVQGKPPPQGSGVRTVGTRLSDGAVNIPAGKWLRKKLRPLSEMYGLGMCLFDSPETYRSYIYLMEWLQM